MGLAMILTIYFDEEYDECRFGNEMKKAREIFKMIWKKEGTGFDEHGNIKGLYECYENMGFDFDKKELMEERGELSILKMDLPETGQYSSFNFHKYKEDITLGNNKDLRDIYLLFAEIVSACFGYMVKMNDEGEEDNYNVIFDEDGYCYNLGKSRNMYLRSVHNIIEIEKEMEKKHQSMIELQNRYEQAYERVKEFE